MTRAIPTHDALGLRKGSRRDHLLRDVKNQVVLIAIAVS